jgi:hypothetical protein
VVVVAAGAVDVGEFFGGCGAEVDDFHGEGEGEACEGVVQRLRGRVALHTIVALINDSSDIA